MPKTLKNSLTIIACLVLIYSITNPNDLAAQSAQKLEKKADESFKNKNYYDAAILYSAILYQTPIGENTEALVYPAISYSKGPVHKIREANINRVKYKLAESYRLYNHFKEAADQYLQYINSKDRSYPLAELWFAHCLLANNEIEKASKAYDSFLKKHKQKDSYSEEAQKGIGSCKMMQVIKAEKPSATITKIQSTISEDGSNFALDVLNDSTFWFTSSRHELGKNQQKTYPLRLYTGSFKTNQVSKAFDQIADNVNMAASSFTADGNTVYFTGWKEDLKTGEKSYAIYSITRTSAKDKFSSPIILPAPVNVKGYHAKQPMITSDGKFLLFSSNQPGGKGKFDIWMVSMDGNKIQGPAINLGATVNTAGNELTAYYHTNSSTLSFSSDGRLGMGGLDIYQVKGSIEKNQWNDSIVHLGIPFNSVKDDQYFRLDNNTDIAYLSSDRSSSCCLEIFKTVKIKEREMVAAVPLFKQKDSVVKQVEIIVVKEPVKAIKLTEDHLLDSINVITYIRRNIYYDFAKTQIRKEDYAALNDIVQVLEKNPELNILIASFTDCKGSQEINIKLSRKRSESVRWYLMAKGISTNRINIDFFGKEHFITQCKEDTSYRRKDQLENRRSDLIITKSSRPKWIPSGRELDIASIKLDSNYHTPEFYEITKRLNISKDVNTNNSTSVQIAKNSVSAEKQHSAYIKEKSSNNRIRVKSETAVEKLPGTTWNYQQQKYLVPLPNKLPMQDMLDMTPHLKESTIIDEMTKRVPRKPVEVYSTSDSVRIDLYDNGIFDYDTVSVIFNKHIAVYKELLQVDKPISFYIKLNSEEQKNEMIFFAENLGLTPPNSALMVITDTQNKRTEVSVASDLNHNVVIYFIKLNKETKKQ